ncbi:ECF-type sigma factor [Singulisphaera rosea]
MADVTQILRRIEQGEPGVAERLLPLVYEELRRLAAWKMAQEVSGQTIRPTALVQEVYLRLLNGEQPQRWESRGHYFAVAAEAMRRILVENARRRKRLKHGGELQRQELTDVAIVIPEIREDSLALDAALDRPKKVDERAVTFVHLRYFVGLSIDDSAKSLGISLRTADRV